MAHGPPKAELDAARALFVEQMYAEAEAAGRKLPADFRSQLKGKTPLRDAWNGMVSRSSNRGHPGGSPVDPAWADEITGFLAFAFAMGARPRQGKAGLARPDTSKPWGPGNARWAKPPKPRSVLTATPAELKAMAPARRARAAALIATRRTKDGDALRPEDFKRHKKNWLYVAHWDMHERMYNPGNAPAQDASDAAWSKAVDEADRWNNYHGRGLYIHEPWRDWQVTGFEDFVADILEEIGPRTTDQHSLDRRDNDQGYRPGNIRWATAEEQRANQRDEKDPSGDADRVAKQHYERAREVGAIDGNDDPVLVDVTPLPAKFRPKRPPGKAKSADPLAAAVETFGAILDADAEAAGSAKGKHRA